jgi:hypothetical protein
LIDSHSEVLSVANFQAYLVLLAVAFVSGCVSGPPHGLTQDQVRSLKIIAVEGVVAPVARANWAVVTDEFRNAKGLNVFVKPSQERDEPQQIVEPPLPLAEFRAFVETRFAMRVQKAFGGPLKAAFAGTRPVKVIVTLHYASIPSGGQRAVSMMLSGQSGDENKLLASVELVDANSKKTIASMPQQLITGMGGGPGLDYSEGVLAIEADPMIRMLNRLRSAFSTWLLPSA